MNAYHWNTLSWNTLMQPRMTGKKIMIMYYGEEPGCAPPSFVEIVGHDHVDNEHVLVVRDIIDGEVYIITRELKSRQWEAYEVLEDI